MGLTLVVGLSCFLVLCAKGVGFHSQQVTNGVVNKYLVVSVEHAKVSCFPSHSIS